ATRGCTRPVPACPRGFQHAYYGVRGHVHGRLRVDSDQTEGLRASQHCRHSDRRVERRQVLRPRVEPIRLREALFAMSAPETVTWTLGSLLGFCGVIGVLVRTWLLPYLREQVVRPIRETHHQVTVNGGNSSPPTMLDKLTAVSG